MNRAGSIAVRRIRREAGFTLIEVMIALAILGVGLFVLLDAQFNSLRMHDRSSEDLEARQLIQRALAQAEIDLLAGNLSGNGDFGKRYPDYTYTYESTLLDENIGGLYTVRVTVQTPKDTYEKSMLVYDTRR